METRDRRGQDRSQRSHDPAAILGKSHGGDERPIYSYGRSRIVVVIIVSYLGRAVAVVVSNENNIGKGIQADVHVSSPPTG